MYRGYNGITYNQSEEGKTLSKFHPGDIIRVTLDMTAGTISYRVNDADQGITFRNVAGTVYPAVAFYGSDRCVRFVKLERLGDAIDGKIYYSVTDSFKRKAFLGNISGSKRNGSGKLMYHDTDGRCGF